jgi:hypothetical protein
MFKTLLPEADSALYAYVLSPNPNPTAFADIRYINDARALSWEAVGLDFLVALDTLLEPPLGAAADNNGSIADVLRSNPRMSTTARLLDKLPEYRSLLAAAPDTVALTGFHTFLSPGQRASVVRGPLA